MPAAKRTLVLLVLLVIMAQVGCRAREGEARMADARQASPLAQPVSPAATAAQSLVQPISPLATEAQSQSSILDAIPVVAGAEESSATNIARGDTWTPWPTDTPWPTPTPIPTPTPNLTFSTGAPLNVSLSDSPAGTILFRVPVYDPRRPEEWPWTGGTDAPIPANYYAAEINARGQPVREAVPWPLAQENARLDELYYPLPSPSGRYIALAVPSMGGGPFYVLDRVTEALMPVLIDLNRAELSADSSDFSVSGVLLDWHPDEQHLLVSVTYGRYPGIWLVHITSGEYLMVGESTDFFRGAALSPTGRWIAYPVGRNAQGEQIDSSYLAVKATDGTLIQAWSHIQVGSIYDGWSPDGKWLLLSGGPQDAKRSKGEFGPPLWLVDPLTGEAKPVDVPFFPYVAYAPQWSPSGQYMAVEGMIEEKPFVCYAKDRTPEEALTCEYANMGIYLVEPETGKVELFIDDGISPTWSPDGTWLAYMTLRDGVPQVWIKNVADGRAVAVTADDRWKWNDLIWLPDVATTGE